MEFLYELRVYNGRLLMYQDKKFTHQILSQFLVSRGDVSKELEEVTFGKGNPRQGVFFSMVKQWKNQTNKTGCSNDDGQFRYENSQSLLRLVFGQLLYTSRVETRQGRSSKSRETTDKRLFAFLKEFSKQLKILTGLIIPFRLWSRHQVSVWVFNCT